jgi:hypothetical protein
MPDINLTRTRSPLPHGRTHNLCRSLMVAQRCLTEPGAVATAFKEPIMRGGGVFCKLNGPAQVA